MCAFMHMYLSIAGSRVPRVLTMRPNLIGCVYFVVLAKFKFVNFACPVDQVSYAYL